MKSLLMVATLSLSLACFGADPAGYDEEMAHNTIHSFEEQMETPRVFTFQSEDTQAFKDAFKVLQKAVTHVHDQLEDHNGTPAVLKAVDELEVPVKSFMIAARENQIKAAKRNLHLSAVLGLLDTYGELKFWTTVLPKVD